MSDISDLCKQTEKNLKEIVLELNERQSKAIKTDSLQLVQTNQPKPPVIVGGAAPLTPEVLQFMLSTTQKSYELCTILEVLRTQVLK